MVAAVAPDLAATRRALREAAQTWGVTGATFDVDRTAVALGSLSDADGTERIAGALARDRLDRAGVAPATDSPTRPRAAIRSLGRFEVSVRDTPVAASAWRSRKARDLLRILTARRGRPISREQLVDLLWPADDADGLAHRLSVALSTVRAVLDPHRQAPADHFVITDPASVALDTGNLAIDLEQFLGEAAHGLRLADLGELSDARTALAAAERRYTGDFLEDEPYEDWALSTREHARATYLRVVRVLAGLSRDAGRTDEAVQYLLRVLDLDPYDERAHQDLVGTLAGAGRHGEARRARQRYLAAMREIGVAPVALPRAVDR